MSTKIFSLKCCAAHNVYKNRRSVDLIQWGVGRVNMQASLVQFSNVAFDRDGFLLEPGVWNEEVARRIAAADGLGPLSDSHLEILQQLRAHYLEHGALMPASHACRVNEKDTHCIFNLFGNMREAWRVAGLPNPGEEAKNYMASR